MNSIQSYYKTYMNHLDKREQIKRHILISIF